LVVLSLVASCGRSRTHSKFKYGVDANAFPHMVFAASSLAPLPAPTQELNLGRNLQLFFSEISLYPIQYSPDQADP
jgi:hypothetical protein